MVKIMENPIRMDDLGLLLFLETPRNFQVATVSTSPVSEKKRRGFFSLVDKSWNQRSQLMESI